MKLYFAPASPYARMARVMAIETGLADQIDEVILHTRPDAPDPVLLAANPLGKLPALVRDDGATVFDSRVICRYLNTRGRANLYPEDKIWDVLTLEALAVGILDAALAMIYEVRFRSGDMVSQDWLDWQWRKVENSLDALGSDRGDLLTGPINAGQVATACAIGYLDFRHGSRNWRDGRENLARWHAEFALRPSIQATEPHD
jgi:glutathione S-transferase